MLHLHIDLVRGTHGGFLAEHAADLFQKGQDRGHGRTSLAFARPAQGLQSVALGI